MKYATGEVLSALEAEYGRPKPEIAAKDLMSLHSSEDEPMSQVLFAGRADPDDLLFAAAKAYVDPQSELGGGLSVDAGIDFVVSAEAIYDWLRSHARVLYAWYRMELWGPGGEDGLDGQRCVAIMPPNTDNPLHALADEENGIVYALCDVGLPELAPPGATLCTVIEWPDATDLEDWLEAEGWIDGPEGAEKSGGGA